jgi:protein-S-isoprenylcysteine O-methyltransferase Ste14
MGSSTTTTQGRTTWQKIARRVRVPLGFVTAVAFMIFAKPTGRVMLYSLILVLPGLWLRAYAAGFVKKNSQLTRTGPYAYTRNPLYLGSLGIAVGFAVASGHWLTIGLAIVTLFAAIYLPTILSEEAFLNATFPGFREYKKRVPRIGIRLTPARFADHASSTGRFSRERYLHHREYNALMGAAAIYALLAAKMVFFRGHA